MPSAIDPLQELTKDELIVIAKYHKLISTICEYIPECNQVITETLQAILDDNGTSKRTEQTKDVIIQSQKIFHKLNQVIRENQRREIERN